MRHAPGSGGRSLLDTGPHPSSNVASCPPNKLLDLFRITNVAKKIASYKYGVILTYNTTSIVQHVGIEPHCSNVNISAAVEG